MSQSEQSPTPAKPTRSAWPTRDQLRVTLDPDHELYGKSWSSDQGWHDPVEGEGQAMIVVPSRRRTGRARRKGRRRVDRQGTPLPGGWTAEQQVGAMKLAAYLATGFALLVLIAALVVDMS